jgi:hypothetical protein
MVAPDDNEVTFALDSADLKQLYSEISEVAPELVKTPAFRVRGRSRLAYYAPNCAGIIVGISVVALYYVSMATYPAITLAAVLAAALAMAAGSRVFEAKCQRRLDAILRGRSGYVCPRCVRVSEEGITDRTVSGETKVSWKQVENIVPTPGFVIVRYRLSKSGEDNIIVVPRHAFPTPVEAGAFITRAGELWKQASEADRVAK